MDLLAYIKEKIPLVEADLNARRAQGYDPAELIGINCDADDPSVENAQPEMAKVKHRTEIPGMIKAFHGDGFTDEEIAPIVEGLTLRPGVFPIVFFAKEKIGITQIPCVNIKTEQWGDYLRRHVPDLSAQLTKAVADGIDPCELVGMVMDGSVPGTEAGCVITTRSVVSPIVAQMRALVVEQPDTQPILDALDHPRRGTLPIMGVHGGACAFALYGYTSTPGTPIALSETMPPRLLN